MGEQLVDFFVSWFVYPGIKWTSLLVGIGLAFAFGAFWFTLYWTNILKNLRAWAVLVGSAIFSLAAITFIQVPLQLWAGDVLGGFWSREVIYRFILLTAIPQVLLSGFIQEGAKLVPVVVWWWRKGRSIDPMMGLAIGAVAGLGLGVFEALWAHNRVFLTGWGWEMVQAQGLMALAPFWERFFTVAIHVGLSALAGYGLARGWGWQFYLLAASLHTLTNYSAVLLVAGLFTVGHVEIYVAVMAVLVTGGVLWLRWRKTEDVTLEE
ncbi:MAG: hypothetical protein KKF26_07010 [Chloroflexi bacterium]|nr:hypothetical protein [Chloroflexota bacterium]